MAEVARRAGVSLSTVSRALADSPLISEATRRLVRDAAESMDYRVDAVGSSLRTGLTRTAGVLIPLAHAVEQKLSDPFFLELIGSIADELAARSYSMLLAKVTEDPAASITTIFRERRADGIIVIGQSLHHDALNALAAADIPLVVWGARLKDQRYVTVGSDNEAGGETATTHLISQGCRRIAFLGDPAAPEVAARLSGHQRALRAANLRRESTLELPVRFGNETAYHAILSLIDNDVAFDGVVACSDVLAMSAMRAMIERDRRIPADVAVVGFDDIPLAALTTPPLTTIRQNCLVGARLLVDKLMRAIAQEPIASELIPTEIMVRGSSLAANRRNLPEIKAKRKGPPAGPRGRASKTG